MSTQLQLVQNLLIETILTPSARCPNCGRELCEEEIRSGWRDDPHDFTTECPSCKTRFVSHIVAANKRTGEEVTYDFLCPLQLFWALDNTLSRYKQRRLGQVRCQKHYPSVFWNMIRHHGTWKAGMQAFKAWKKAA